MTAAMKLPQSAYRIVPQFDLSFGDDEIFVDNFAGWGGASVGIEEAIGKPVDIAINHSKIAIEMHKVNHPRTLHLCEDVFDVDPVAVVAGRPVGGAWFSPDCTHFSNAKGGTPVSKKIRGLAWVAVRWAARVKPRVIWLENVREFMTWGRLMQKRDAAGNLMFKNGEPWMIPDPAHKGEFFRAFIARLERLGYKVEFKVLTVSDYGVATIRKRFFMIARRDGQPITWPAPDHMDPKKKGFRQSGLKRWVPVHKFIDFARPCPSIFLTKEEGAAIGVKRPLAENTMARIARGVHKYVLNNPRPFIVRICQQGFGGNGMQYSTDEPLTTIVTKQEHCLVMPSLIQTGWGERDGQAPRSLDLERPLGTVMAGGQKHALCATFLAKHYGGNYTGSGADLRDPLPTATATDHNALVTSHLTKFNQNSDGQELREPLHTVMAGATRFGEVRAFLIKYYSSGGQWGELTEPLPTCTGNDRIGLVLVKGELYQIVDIGMRMLDPDELFAASSFPKNYVIDTDSRGRRIPKYVQTAGVGNSVPPLMARKLVEANYRPARRAVAA